MFVQMSGVNGSPTPSLKLLHHQTKLKSIVGGILFRKTSNDAERERERESVVRNRSFSKSIVSSEGMSSITTILTLSESDSFGK